MNDSDCKFMELAIEAARELRGDLSDPLVSAVAVFDGKMLAVAYREKKSWRTCRVYSVREIPTKYPLAEATVYTTLEPCTTRNFPKLAYTWTD